MLLKNIRWWLFRIILLFVLAFVVRFAYVNIFRVSNLYGKHSGAFVKDQVSYPVAINIYNKKQFLENEEKMANMVTRINSLMDEQHKTNVESLKENIKTIDTKAIAIVYYAMPDGQQLFYTSSVEKEKGLLGGYTLKAIRWIAGQKEDSIGYTFQKVKVKRVPFEHGNYELTGINLNTKRVPDYEVLGVGETIELKVGETKKLDAALTDGYGKLIDLQQVELTWAVGNEAVVKVSELDPTDPNAQAPAEGEQPAAGTEGAEAPAEGAEAPAEGTGTVLDGITENIEATSTEGVKAAFQKFRGHMKVFMANLKESNKLGQQQTSRYLQGAAEGETVLVIRCNGGLCKVVNIKVTAQ